MNNSIYNLMKESTSKLIFIEGLGFTVLQKKKEPWFTIWLKGGELQ